MAKRATKKEIKERYHCIVHPPVFLEKGHFRSFETSYERIYDSSQTNFRGFIYTSLKEQRHHHSLQKTLCGSFQASFASVFQNFHLM